MNPLTNLTFIRQFPGLCLSWVVSLGKKNLFFPPISQLFLQDCNEIQVRDFNMSSNISHQILPRPKNQSYYLHTVALQYILILSKSLIFMLSTRYVSLSLGYIKKKNLIHIISEFLNILQNIYFSMEEINEMHIWKLSILGELKFLLISLLSACACLVSNRLVVHNRGCVWSRHTVFSFSTTSLKTQPENLCWSNTIFRGLFHNQIMIVTLPGEFKHISRPLRMWRVYTDPTNFQDELMYCKCSLSAC